MRKLFRRLDALFHRRRLRAELAEEMAAHREMMEPGRRRYFGSDLHLQEAASDQWGFAWLDQFRQDLAYGARSLLRSPAFTLTAIAVLSLGIGANLAEFHIFEALLHRLNVRGPESLCQFVRMTRQRPSSEQFSLPEIEFYRRHNTTLSAVLSVTNVPDVRHAQDTAELRCMLVSGNYFGELGVSPLYGRVLNDRDDRPGAPAAVDLDSDYWRNRFAGDPGIVGRIIRLNDKPVEVVGIVPFSGLLRHANVWLTISQYPYLAGDSGPLADYGMRGSYMFGRLKPGLSAGAAEAEFRRLTAALHEEEPESVGQGDRLRVEPTSSEANLDTTAMLLVGTFVLLVLLVLFSACANLGNMLLARSLARQREIEIRFAIGAGRARLVRQLMTENLLLAAVSALAALFVGNTAATILLRVLGAPSRMRVVTDWPIVLSAAALALVSTLAFGLAPAWQMVRRGPKATRARKILVSIQVAASCVLLILSSFLTLSIQQTLHSSLAFDPSGLAVVDPFFSLHRYPPAQAHEAALEMAARLRQVPGVEAAALATVPPLRRSRIEYAGAQKLYLNGVDPAYFPLMRLPLVAGRLFAPEDRDAAVISESAARRLWPGESPLGRRIFLTHRDRTVVGVVRDSGLNQLTVPDSVEAYTTIDNSGMVYATVLVRAATAATNISSALQSAAAAPGISPLVFTFDGLVEQQLSSIRNMVKVVTSLAAVATLLALLGVFGLLAFTVAQRTREIGIRMALGARRFDILRIVLGQYAIPFGSGAIAGIALAACSVKVIRGLVYGFVPFDLRGFGAGLLLFAAVALAASIVPARRALRIDPASALRYE